MTKSVVPAGLAPEQLLVVIDQREQIPLDVAPLRHRFGHLETADYSIEGLEERVAFERKSLTDLLSCCGTARERFERELLRLRGYEVKGLVIETTWPEIELGQWRSKIKPAAVTGSLMAWSLDGLPIWFARDHQEAGRLMSRLLFLAGRRYYRSMRRFTLATLAAREEACRS